MNKRSPQGIVTTFCSGGPPIASGETLWGCSTREIPLTQGKVALVDAVNYGQLNQYKWWAVWSGWDWYAQSKIDSEVIYMHIFLMSPPKGLLVDHHNGDGLDNRKENLRICTNQQNEFNRRIQIHSSQYKGVCWDKKSNKWRAMIKFNHILYHLGFFCIETEAAQAYDAAARKYFGEFARLNFSAESTSPSQTLAGIGRR